MSDSVRPHRRQPTRLLGPWDSPGKNTEVGCHFLLQGSSLPRAQTHVSVSLALVGVFSTTGSTWEAHIVIIVGLFRILIFDTNFLPMKTLIFSYCPCHECHMCIWEHETKNCLFVCYKSRPLFDSPGIAVLITRHCDP